MTNDRAARMDALIARLNDFIESPLYDYRVKNNYHPVIGEGSLHAAIMFIGEAPGANEAKQGRPFVGASGRVLNELLGTIGLAREDVYITNVVKDRPPDNRDPKPAEIELYAPFLSEQIELIQPQVIATLGRFAMEFVLTFFGFDPQRKISEVHGTPIEAQAGFGAVTVVPLYHPAVALYQRTQRPILEQDFAALKQFVTR